MLIVKRSKSTGKPNVVLVGEQTAREAINSSLESTLEYEAVNRPQRRTHTWHNYNIDCAGIRDNQRLGSYSAVPTVEEFMPTFLEEPLAEEHEPVFDYHCALEFTPGILKNYTVDHSTVLLGSIKDAGTDGKSLFYVGTDGRTTLKTRPGVSIPSGFESKQFQEDIAANRGDTDRLSIYK